MASCTVGDTLPIRWLSSDKAITAVELDITADNGVTWVSICDHAVKTDLTGEYLWTVPDSIEGNPRHISLIGRKIYFRVTGYQNKLARTVGENAVRVVDRSSSVRFTPGVLPLVRVENREPIPLYYTTTGRKLDFTKKQAVPAGILIPDTRRKLLILN
jgi:hypothetical protein